MERIEKTIFICYRRTNFAWAVAVYQYLTSQGYDVFIDYLHINSGDFRQVIIDNIRSRAHFVVILTPSALERCDRPNDWLRLEIETAIDTKRNIIPLMLESFEYDLPAIEKQLSGKLSNLRNYSSLRIYSEFFLESMDRLRDRYLNVKLSAVLHPPSEYSLLSTNQQKAAAAKALPIQQVELTSQEWFEKGFKVIDLDEKIYCYQKSIDIDPNNAASQNNLGNLYSDMEKPEEALPFLLKAIELDPDNASPHSNLGGAFFSLGKINDAYKSFLRSTELDPNFAAPHHGLGILFSATGKQEEAIDSFLKAIKLDPCLPSPRYYLGILYSKMGKQNEAIATFQEAIDLEPRLASFHLRLAILHQNQGEHNKAIASYKKVIELEPNDPAPYNNLGSLYSSMGYEENALETFHKAINLDPSHTSPRIGLGFLYQTQGKYKEAIEQYKIAVYLDSESLVQRVSLAACYRLLGQEDNYLKHIDIASSYLGNGSIYVQACFYSVSGNIDKAITLLKFALENNNQIIDLIRTDPNLEFIRDNPQYKNLIQLE